MSQKVIRRKKNVKKGIQFCLMVCGASGTGMATVLFIRDALRGRTSRLTASLQAGPPSSTRSAASLSSSIRKPTMLPTRTSKRASRSSLLRLVRDVELETPHSFAGHPLTAPLELELDEEGTRISLTIVDTPGFGDQIDNEARLAPHSLPFRPCCVAY